MKNEDAELIQRTLAGDNNAFSELVEKYRKQIHALAWRKIGDFHTAEDITQDTFLKAYQRLHTLKEPQRFAGWLYVIATRRCLAWFRKKQLWHQTLENIDTPVTNKDAYSRHVVEEQAKTANEAQQEVVKKLLETLKESDRTVITLHYFSEMTCEQISEFLGVSANTIKSRLRRARNRLKKEEPMIKEAIGNFQISPNLTDNIMQEVAKLKPGASSASKPLVPWIIGVSSAVLIVLMLGIGSQYLARFQQPYSLDAQTEMTVELIDAPIMLNLEAKSDVRQQLGNSNAFGESDNNGQKPDEILLAAAQAEGDDLSVPKQQWIQSSSLSGSSAHSFLATPEGDLYTLVPASGKIYKLPANGKTWQDISNVEALYQLHPGDWQPLAKWNNTLYFMPSSELFASKDDGKTWDLLYSWQEKHQNSIGLILTDHAFYIAFDSGVFSSKDTGKTWKQISDRLTGINSLVEVQNTLFTGTDEGFYRLDADGWKRMKFPESIKGVYSVSANRERVYVLAELSRAGLNPEKVSRGHERGWGVFGTSNLGNSWLDITPINAWAVNGFIPDAKLIAIGETLLLMERGMVRSNDSGITWSPPQLAGTSPQMDSRSPATVVNTGDIYVGSHDGLHRSTDGGKSWEKVNITPDDSGIDNLIVFKETESGQNISPDLYGRVGLDVVKTTDAGKSWKNVPVEIPMSKPHREQDPSINQIAKSGGVIYASVDYNENGEKVRLYRLSADNRRFAPIQDVPLFDSDMFEPLERTLFRKPSVEHLQDSFSGAAQFFKQLVQGDNRKQGVLIRNGLRGPFAVSDDTFYMEYNFKLFRWKADETEWYDTEQEETVELSLRIASRDLKLAVLENTVYVGKRDGHLVVSFDRGTNWLDLTPALPFQFKTFKEIVFAGSTVYVATDVGVATSDSGKNWRAITDAEGTNLVMEQLAVDGATLYGITKDTGIYCLKSSTWEQVVSEIPDRVTSLAVDGNTLYVSTEDNGMLHYSLEE